MAMLVRAEGIEIPNRFGCRKVAHLPFRVNQAMAKRPNLRGMFAGAEKLLPLNTFDAGPGGG